MLCFNVPNVEHELQTTKTCKWRTENILNTISVSKASILDKIMKFVGDDLNVMPDLKKNKKRTKGYK